MSNAYRVAAKIIKPKNEREDEEQVSKKPYDAHFEKAQRRDVIANYSCLRDDINLMGARRDSLIIDLLNLSHNPTAFSLSALGLAREADTLTKTINLLSDGKYKHNINTEETVEGN